MRVRPRREAGLVLSALASQLSTISREQHLGILSVNTCVNTVGLDLTPKPLSN